MFYLRSRWQSSAYQSIWLCALLSITTGVHAEEPDITETWHCVEAQQIESAGRDILQLSQALSSATALTIGKDTATFGEEGSLIPDTSFRVLADGNGMLILSGGYRSVKDQDCVAKRKRAGLPDDRTICIENCPDTLFAAPGAPMPTMLPQCDVTFRTLDEGAPDEGDMIWIGMILDRANGTLERSILIAATRETRTESLSCARD